MCANAGVDLSNAAGPDQAILLPSDPDASAARLREEISGIAGQSVGVVITDTFGRPWRDQRFLLRSGGRAGDALWVSGPLGEAAAGFAAELFQLQGSVVTHNFIFFVLQLPY